MAESANAESPKPGSPKPGPGDAAAFSLWRTVLSGFAQFGRKLWAVPVWVAANAMLVFLFVALLILAAQSPVGETLSNLFAGKWAYFDNAEGLDRMLRLVALAILLLPLTVFLFTLVPSAMTRAVLTPRRLGFGYLHLGADELRVAANQVLIGLALFAAGALFVMPLAFLFGLLGQVLPWLNGIAAHAIIVGWLVLTCWMASRFALANAISLDRKKIGAGESWRLTRGRSLRVLLTLVLANLLAVVVYLALACTGEMAIRLLVIGHVLPETTTAIAFARLPDVLGGGIVGALHDFRSLSDLFGPRVVPALMLDGLVWSVFLMFSAAPSVRIYQALRTRKDDKTPMEDGRRIAAIANRAAVSALGVLLAAGGVAVWLAIRTGALAPASAIFVPEVQAVVDAATVAQAEAGEAAKRAAVAADAAEKSAGEARLAAEHARAGDEGYRAYDCLNVDRMQMHYEGQFDYDSGERHGYGVLRWENGSRFEGLFIRNGYGASVVFFYPARDGEKRERFAGDYGSGHGAVIWRSGYSYFGEIRNYKRSGAGIKSGPDGWRFEGIWRDNQPNGPGFKRLCAACNTFVGVWKSGVLQGYGAELTPDGKVVHQGQYADGKLVSELWP